MHWSQRVPPEALAIVSALASGALVWLALRRSITSTARNELKQLSKIEREGRVRLQIALGAAQDNIKALEAAMQAHGVPESVLEEIARAKRAKKGSKKDVHVPLLTVQTIGTITSPYSTRNGTPRQPSLVKTSVAKLQLSKHIPPSALLSLEQFSHAWVVFHFHQNTNVHKPAARAKGTIKPPRLNGESVGVLATRSPHRPAPIGLSLAKIIQVNAKEGYVLFQGLDLVHGTPIVDIKPYVAFSDTPEESFAPGWVGKEHAEDEEPLTITEVAFDDGAYPAMENAYKSCKLTRAKLCAINLFPKFEDFVAFVEENLLLDMRATRERVDPKLTQYRVTLSDIVIHYRVTPSRSVVVIGAEIITEDMIQPLNE
ncbi:hypothetical protein THRCLA_04085 [Thraustotheca clavata]|uniref:TsaA-like domain-containing protein n=1 Tax=Thraustotheca clavata TaxID=74557 RepID=A0A1V9ZZZ3_9STRA|nr:hypothetical protein THRCLA_04085 [Thraustotheca clavata]